MKKVDFFTPIVLVLLVYDVEAKVFTKCGLTKELLNNGFERSYVGNWVCMIESESAKNTSKVTERADRSKSLGLFQINDKVWCKWGAAGGKCQVKCERVPEHPTRNMAHALVWKSYLKYYTVKESELSHYFLEVLRNRRGETQYQLGCEEIDPFGDYSGWNQPHIQLIKPVNGVDHPSTEG
ncbi:hypothetical protein HUJ05_012382 [Dendroctonus ponderosae]|nr:hypothetical protein HUJ05_012382 [Dendroctonus ponderosae]